MLQYIKGLSGTIRKVYTRMEYKYINARLDRFKKKYSV